VQIIRTLVWIVITIILVAFIAMNWQRAPVNIWPLESSYLQLDWPVGFTALVFFLLGFIPMWLYHRAGRWRWQRRMASLEHSLRTTATPPLATSTQLEAHQPQQQSEEPPA
jgi:lipopolysaccharide assembly protein A